MIRYQFTSDWYHFYFHQICTDFTANNKINRVYSFSYFKYGIYKPREVKKKSDKETRAKSCSRTAWQYKLKAPKISYHLISFPASVAQLDAPSDWRPGGGGFNPRRCRQHSFVEIDHEIFSTVILSLPLIQEGQLSVSGERMCIILVNRLED